MNEDKITYLKNMHTKGELAKMYLEIRNDTLKEVEEMINSWIVEYDNKECNRGSCSSCSHNHTFWVIKQELQKLKEKRK